MTTQIKKAGISIFVLLLTVLSAGAKEMETQVIAVINKASWCHVCQENGPRVESEIVPTIMDNPKVMLVVNDLSNKKSKKASKPMLEKAGLVDFAKENTGTGVIYFIDANSKEVLFSLSVAKSSDEILEAYNRALSAEMPACGEEGHKCSAACHAKK